ncbi:hypothetical protein QFC20_005360 [Naganishia adeliensis]|uniref:Uncharacterized protein n=1 Tax=Naganishia adeliensis TaxID=92952 RepID=A0ACC2VQF3_9TREE|nr:hypothetical protein QFC20_005360 [Naganishia adeliensis]
MSTTTEYNINIVDMISYSLPRLPFVEARCGTVLRGHVYAEERRVWIAVSSIVAASTITFLTLTYTRIHADAQAHGAVVPEPRAGKTDERTLQGEGLIPTSEVEKHATKEDCWVVIGGQVWDMTNFLQSHPGGAQPILRAAGKDATNLFNALHPPGTLEPYLPTSHLSVPDDGDEEFPGPRLVGLVDQQTIVGLKMDDGKKKEEGERAPLAQIVGLPDFEPAAEKILTNKAWSYYSAGATDELTLALNKSAYNAILFRPRVMIDVDEVDTRTQFLGHAVDLPVFIAPAGMAKLSHPAGEALFAKAAGEEGIIQFISTNASAKLDDIVSARTTPEQVFFMQLYVDRQRAKSEALLRRVEGLGLKAVFVTVDAAAPGKREADERGRAEIEVSSAISGGSIKSDAKGGGIGRSVGGFIDPKLNWNDIAWLRRHTDLPIGLKGIQTVEDAKRAYDMGCEAIYLSNHGGRALDGSPPALYTLLEINKFYPEIITSGKCEIYIDGGIRRGTDVVKALCLGAKGVGMGRPFMYALTYGEEGVRHAIDIVRDEVQTTMRLLGVTKLSQLGPHLVRFSATQVYRRLYFSILQLNTKAIDPLLADKPMYSREEQVQGHR